MEAVAERGEDYAAVKLLGKQRIAASLRANWLERKRKAEALTIENAAKRQRCIELKLERQEKDSFWASLNAASDKCLPVSDEHFWDDLDPTAAACGAPAPSLLESMPDEARLEESALFDIDCDEAASSRDSERLQTPAAPPPCLKASPAAPPATARERLAAVRQRFSERQAVAANATQQQEKSTAAAAAAEH